MVGQNETDMDAFDMVGVDRATVDDSDSDDAAVNEAFRLHKLQGLRMVDRMRQTIDEDYQKTLRVHMELVEMTAQRDDLQNKYNNALREKEVMEMKFNKLLVQKNGELTRLMLITEEMIKLRDDFQLNYNDISQAVDKNNAQKNYTDVLSIIPQPLISSSSMENLNSAESIEQKSVKLKRRKKSHAAIKQPDINSLELTPKKRSRTKSQQAKPDDIYEIQKSPTIASADYTFPENYEPDSQAALKQPNINLLELDQNKLPRTKSQQAKPDDICEIQKSSTIASADYTFPENLRNSNSNLKVVSCNVNDEAYFKQYPKKSSSILFDDSLIFAFGCRLHIEKTRTKCFYSRYKDH